MLAISNHRGFAFLPIILLVGILFVGTGIGVVATRKFDSYKNETPKQVESTENLEPVQVPIDVVEYTDTPSTTVSQAVNSESNPEPTVKIQSTKIVKTEIPPAAITAVPETKVTQPVETMSIFSVDKVSVDTTEDTATIIWETTSLSDSRLVLHVDDETKIYISSNTGSKTHSVDIDMLESSTKYTYEIIASTLTGDEISKFGSFSTRRIYEAGYIYLMDDNSVEDQCTVIAIKDTAGRPLVGEVVKISGFTHNAGGRYAFDIEDEITDKDGGIEYCRKASEIKLVISSIDYTFMSKEPNMYSWVVERPE